MFVKGQTVGVVCFSTTWGPGIKQVVELGLSSEPTGWLVPGFFVCFETVSRYVSLTDLELMGTCLPLSPE